MEELSHTEKCIVAGICAVNVQRFRKWSIPAGIALLIAAAGVYMTALRNREVLSLFATVLLLLSVGGTLIDTPRLYGVIQKLSQASHVKDEIAKINVNRLRAKTAAWFVIGIPLVWLAAWLMR